MTNEPPRGLKANLQRLYATIDDRQLEVAQNAAEFRRLLFAFSFFHAVVQVEFAHSRIRWYFSAVDFISFAPASWGQNH